MKAKIWKNNKRKYWILSIQAIETSNQFWHYLLGIFISEFFDSKFLLLFQFKVKNAKNIFDLLVNCGVLNLHIIFNMHEKLLAVNNDFVYREGRYFRLFIAKKISNIQHGISAIWQLLKVVV